MKLLINEVCQTCSLTKKAVQYYEKQGLIHPEIGENGYRNYSAADVLVLKEIAVLRKLGLSIAQIKHVLNSSNKSLTLSKLSYLQELKQEKESIRQKCLAQLMHDYNLDKVMDCIDSSLNQSLTIREKLTLSFPGSFGVYLAVHFGQFLNETIETDEQQEAYTKITHFLDNLRLSKETEEYLETLLPIMEKGIIEEIDHTISQALDCIEDYMEENKSSLEAFLQFRTSAVYKSSAAFKLQQIILEMQQENQYEEVFIENLKILSSSYREYVEKLEKANQLLLDKYPEMTRIKLS